MGKILFHMKDQETGREVAGIEGLPRDVADFLTIWGANAAAPMEIARILGVKLTGEE